LPLFKVPTLVSKFFILHFGRWSHGWPKHVAVYCVYKTNFSILYFKLSPCTEYRMLSFGRFPGVWNLSLIIPQHCPQTSSFYTHLPAYEDGTDKSVPKRRHINFRRRRITQKKAYNIISVCLLCKCWYHYCIDCPFTVGRKTLSVQSERFTLVVGNQSESMNGYNICVI